MKIEFTSRNYELSEKLKGITEQKLKKLDKYFTDEDARVKVSFKRQASSLTTEVMLDYLGKFVRATATSDNFYDNIDVVIPKIEGQIRKYRTRFDKHQKNSAYREQAVFETADREETEATIVKDKKFKLTPMTVNEAMEEMELLGHSFYVFLEAKSNTVQVIYKRKDGDLGLIEPEI
ncbi:MAG: ribosome-associated translation inhibitor RaiA [Clostridiales bacterium]|nr:ribosome-associated translation inhibitor RaiA [Clostridiales bacterium]